MFRRLRMPRRKPRPCVRDLPSGRRVDLVSIAPLLIRAPRADTLVSIVHWRLPMPPA